MPHDAASPSHRPAFGIDVSISFFSQLIIFGLALATTTLIARTLGPAGKGVYSLAILIPTLGAAFVSLGMNISIVYLIGKRHYSVGSIFGTMLVSSAMLGIGVTAILLVVLPGLTTTLLAGSPRTYLLTTLPMIPILLMFETMYYVVLGHRAIVQLTVFQLVRPLSYLGILVWLYWTSELSVYRAIWSNIAGLLIGCAIAAYVVVRNGYSAGFAVRRVVLVDALRFGIKQHVGSMFQLLNYRVNVLIVAAFLTPSAVGWYLVAVLITEACWHLPNALGRILYPKTATSDTEAANKFTPLVCRNTLLWTTVIALAMFSTAERIIPWLLTAQFEPSIMAVKLLLPGVVFFSVSKVLGADLAGRGLPQYNTYGALAALVMTVVCDLALIPRYGISGAALACSIAYATSAGLVVSLFKRTTGIPLRDILLVRPTDVVVYQRMLKLLSSRRSVDA